MTDSDRPAKAKRRALEACPSADTGARAPGRANLIGEHTDYNEGFVLPVALELGTYIVGRRTDGLHLVSLDAPDDVVVDLNTGDGPEAGWGRYVTAVVRALLEAGHRPRGLDGVVASDVPAGAGLSSSAALEVALATALVPGLEGLELAKVCQRAENHFVGVACGLMDQLASSCGAQGKALLIDCRSNDVEFIPIPDSIALLVVDSSVRRDLASSAYNEREQECRKAAEELGVDSLRKASIDDLSRLKDHPVLQRRARHVITENRRVIETAAALRERRLADVSQVFYESHQSYARDFEASTAEIDELVSIARGTPGVIGARLTGGGFGGCTVNLVEADKASAASDSILHSYKTSVGLHAARAWIGAPGRGAESFHPSR